MAMTSSPLALFGVSGAGKSTLLKLVAGLITPDRGRISLGGTVLFDSEKNINIPPEKRRIGYVFQDGRLFPNLNVEKNLLYGFSLIPLAERKLGLGRVCDILALRLLLKRRVSNLSGGEKQRVALGRALLLSPRLLLMDEPLAALDAGLKSQIISFIRRIKDEFRIPIIYVSHSLREILQLTREIAVMNRGRLLAGGDYYSVINEPTVFQLANSLGLENILPVTILRHDEKYQITFVDLRGQELCIPHLDQPVGGRHYISISPADIVISKERQKNISAQNALAGKVHNIAVVGDRVLVQIDIGLLLLSEITIKATEKLELKKGSSIYCLIKTYACRPLGLNA